MSAHCHGLCGDCRRVASEHAILFATFRCSSCAQLVGWCEGGTPTPEDPNGDRCAKCANLYHDAIAYDCESPPAAHVAAGMGIAVAHGWRPEK